MTTDYDKAPRTVKRVAAEAKKSAKDAAKEQIQERNETGSEAAATRSFYNDAVYVHKDEDRCNGLGEAWLVSDNYDRMGSLIYYPKTDEWYFQSSYGSESRCKNGEAEALANAALMFHG